MKTHTLYNMALAIVFSLSIFKLQAQSWMTNGNTLYSNSSTANVAIGTGSISLGNPKLQVNGSVLFNGTTGNIPATGAGTRMMWYPAKSAFRAGYVTGTAWDDVNTGIGSTSFGLDNVASGNFSFIVGNGNTVSGVASSAFGSANTVSGNRSFASGGVVSVSGIYSFAQGQYINATNSFTNIFGTGYSQTAPLVNNIPYSFMVGYQSSVPTLFVGPPAVAGTNAIGTVGIGTTTIPTNAPSGGYQLVTLGNSNFNGSIVVGDPTTITSATPFPASYKLFVTGGILTERIKVAVKTTANWSDFVFAPDYKLKPLASVEAYIHQNKHLPDVPSAEEVVANGVDVLEMNAKLLQKIEELTLYMIEMNKENERLKRTNDALYLNYSDLNKRIQAIENK